MSCFGGSAPAPDTTMQDTISDISRQDYDNFRKNYAGLAQELVTASNSDEVIRDNVDRAAARVDPAFATSERNVRNQVDRYNMQLTPDQTRALELNHSLGKNLATVGAKNRARQSGADLQNQLRGDVIALGQGEKDASMGDYATAANLEQNRNTTNLNNAAQHKSSMAGLVSSLGSMAGTALILSSKKAKKDVKPADKAGATKEVRQLDVKNYQYKDGKGPAGTRTGVIAEDSPAVATADKSKVDLGDWTGKLTLAVQDIAENQDKTNQRLLKLERAG